MKVLSRINRGVILTAVVLTAVITYLFVLSTIRSTDRPAIRELCAGYIQAAIQYTLLPERFRTDPASMTATVKEQYLLEMETALGPFYIKDEQIRKFNLDNQKSRLASQMRGVGVVFDYQKTIQKYQSFAYNKDLVTVTVITHTVYDGPVMKNRSLGRQKAIGETSDTLVLKKEGGEWHIVYAVLIIPGNEGS